MTTNPDVPVNDHEAKPLAKSSSSVAVSQPSLQPAQAPLTWKTDLWWCLGLALLGLAGAYLAAGRVDPIVFQHYTQDTWFDADIYRVAEDMTSRTTSHFRSNVHPLFSLLVYPVTTLIRTTFGISAGSAIEVVLALATAALLSVFFLLLRLLGCRRLDATIFSLLLATSASTIFFIGVPDTFLLGSLSILAALCVAALAARRRIGETWFVIVSALSLSFTTTNWMAGIATTFGYHRWRRALQLTVNAFAVVVVLWGLENILFKGISFFFVLRSESHWILTKGLGGWPAVAKVFFFHSIIMPKLTVLHASSATSAWPLLSVQTSPLASGTVLGLPAVILWIALLVTGLYALATMRNKVRFRMVLGLVVAGQLSLHLLYGPETFLFAPHYVPLLILVAALGTQTKARRIILVASVLLIACCAYNNIIQFGRANRYIRSFSQQRSTQVVNAAEMEPGGHGPNLDAE